MKKSTKNTLVGASVGAATGALVNKNNRSKGALVGLVAGTLVAAGINYVSNHCDCSKKRLPHQR